MKKLLLGLGILPCLVFAQSDDNEVWIEQSGDTFKLYIDQVGFIRICSQKNRENNNINK